MTIWNGVTEQGAVVPIQVDAQGRVVVAGGGGTPSEVYGTAKAAGLFNADGSTNWAMNLSGSKTGTGAWTMTFSTPLPSNQYAVLSHGS